MVGVMKLLSFFLLGLLDVLAYRPESLLNVAHILKGGGDEPGDEGEVEKGEPPKEAVKDGKDQKDPEEKPKDCFWHLKAAKNWKVKFPPLDLLQKQIEDQVRTQSLAGDDEDNWANLIKIDGKAIEMYLGAYVFFNQSDKGPDCEGIKEEDLRLSSSVECKEPGEHIEQGQQAMSIDGMHGFLLKTSNSTVVLQRSEQAEESLVIGDWTFPAGDFSISKKEGGRLEIQQKMWNHTVAYNGTVTGPEDKTKYTAEMMGLDSECAKFKLEKCPENMCKIEGSTCKADRMKNHKVTLIIDPNKPNDLTRIVDDKDQYAVKRSFVPVEAEADAFVCVKVNDTWMAIRGMSYKQLSSNAQKVKDAEDSNGMKVFEGKSFGKQWLEEEHIMEDGLFIKGGHQPPWTKSIKATVQWKKAEICPERFPLCYEDGDCVAEDCKNGCEWSRSPTVDNKDEEYNYIAGMDTFGTACDTDNEVLRNSASCLSFLAVVATFLYQIL